MPTLKDISLRAGVNVSTVSKALSGKDDISSETALMVRMIAKEMGYESKKKPRNGLEIIGVICPEIESNYYSQLLSWIERYVKDKGYSLYVGFSDYLESNEIQYIEKFIRTKVDGIIYISENRAIGRTFAKAAKRISIPITAIAQNNESRDFDCIRIDDDYGVRIAVEHMISKGHRNICYIGDNLSDYTRKMAFKKVLQEAGIEIIEEWIYTGSKRFEECGYEGMKKILSQKRHPTAVFAAYDDIAIGAMKAIYEKGLIIPEDISIAAIDDIRISEYLHPGLTTVACPIKEMARIAVSTLMYRIESNEDRPTQSVSLNPELMLRRSVGFPKTC